MSTPKKYTSDLTDAEWEQIEPLLPPEKPVGRGRAVNLREVLNAIYYRADNGVKWRNLPSDFPAIALWAFKKGRRSTPTFGLGCAWGCGKTLIWLWSSVSVRMSAEKQNPV
jgi:transposase